MKKSGWSAIVLIAASLGNFAAQAGEGAAEPLRIGFISDLSGLYADLDGPAGAEAVRMAVADFGGTVLGRRIEVLVADHQNKPDIASAKAREWFDQQGLDMLVGGTNSGAALAMAKVAAEKKKPYMAIGAGTTRLTNEDCTPYTVHYAYDTYALANVAGPEIVKRGGKTWFFLTADYAFGHSLEKDTAAVVTAAGGKVLGAVRHPLSASDFSSFMLQAQASKAQILGLANAGGDTINAVKAAREFGVTRSMRLAGMLVFINDVHSLGLANTQGMLLTDGWYWDLNDETRAWSKKFFARFKRQPSMLQAADYSATMQYLQAVRATGTDAGDAVMAQLRKTRINDFFARNGTIRADGRMMHEMYLMEVKAPSESLQPWDYYKVLARVPAERAYQPLEKSGCPLIRNAAPDAGRKAGPGGGGEAGKGPTRERI